MVKSTNNCATWWNSSQQHPNNTQTTLNLNYTSTIPYHNTTIAKHGEIHNQLPNMVKYTKITQQGEISQTIRMETNNVKDFYRNCKNSCSCCHSSDALQLFVVNLVYCFASTIFINFL